MKKIENLVWVIFIFFGIILGIFGFIIGGYLFLNNENKVEATAVITEIKTYGNGSKDRRHEVIVSYYVNGEERESRLWFYSSDFYEGKEITIYYHKDNPQKIGAKTSYYLFLIIPGIGLIFLVIGLSGILMKRKKKNLHKKLREEGYKIYANYIQTSINTSYTVNRQHPYNIICEWYNPSDNRKYRFKSENIWGNPESIIKEKGIETFPVYINREKMKQYVMEIDEVKLCL